MMVDSAPIVLSTLRVSATVGGTSFSVRGDANNNIDTTNDNMDAAVTENVSNTGNGTQTRKKRNASGNDGVAIAKPARTKKRKSPSGKGGSHLKLK